MRSKNNLPRIQNGTVTTRHNRSRRPSKTPGSSGRVSIYAGSDRANRYHNNNRRNHAERGSKILWLMILIGTLLAAGFVMALRSQNNAYQLGQAEEELRARLDDYSNQQKYLMLDQQRARSASESAQAGKEAGLAQLRLNQPNELRNSSVQKASIATAQKVSAQKASLAMQRPVAQKVSTAAQRASIQRKSTQADQRNQSAKARRDRDSRRQTASRSHQRR